MSAGPVKIKFKKRSRPAAEALETSAGESKKQNGKVTDGSHMKEMDDKTLQSDPGGAAPQNKKTKRPRKSQAEIQKEKEEIERHKLLKASSAVREYLESWAHRETSGWRFKKLLQVWIIQHLYDKDAVDKELFKMSLPYLQGLQGSACERVLSEAAKVLEACRRAQRQEASEDEDAAQQGEIKEVDQEIVKLRKRRAKKVIKALEAHGENGADQQDEEG